MDSIRLAGVSKTQKTPFSRKPGFRLGPLDLRVGEGEILGLLGANGAGKTTTLKLLMGLLVPDAGTIQLMGHASASDAWRSAVGYLPEQPAFYDYLTGREFLALIGELFSLPKPGVQSRIAGLLERVGLAASGDRRIRTYSKGMQQRLGLAQALLNEPRLVVFDEPMSGLDPLGRRMVRDLLLELKAKGTSILFSTHIIPDAEFICDRIALMKEGKLIAVGTLDDLLGIPTEFEIAYTRASADATGMQRVTLRAPKDELSTSIAHVMAGHGHLVSVTPVRASVEDLIKPQSGVTE